MVRPRVAVTHLPPPILWHTKNEQIGQFTTRELEATGNGINTIHTPALNSRHTKTLFRTQYAAGFAAKGLFIHTVSSSVATGLAHSMLIIRLDPIRTRRAMLRYMLGAAA